MASNVVTVSILGNTRGLRRALNNARKDLGGLEKISGNLTGAFKVAGIAAAVFGAAAVGAAAVGTAAMLGLSAAVVGVGVALAAQNQEVKDAFSDLADFVGPRLKDMAAPFVPVLVETADALKEAFLSIEPILTDVFSSAADLLGDLNEHLEPLGQAIADMLRVGFEASAPVLDAFIGSLDLVFDGLRDMFRELSRNGGSEVFARFAEAFNGAIGDLLVVIGQLARALAPLGTAILELVVDGLERFGDYVERTLVPAVEDLAHWMGENEDIVRNAAAAFLGVWAAIKGATVITTVISLLGLLLTPVGLVIGVLAGLVLGFKYAWDNSETFRDRVNAAITTVRDWWDDNGQQIIDNAKDTWNDVVEFVRPIVDRFLEIANDVISDVRAWWEDNGDEILTDAVGTFESIRDDVGPILEDLREIVLTVLDGIELLWNLFGDDLLAYVGGLWRGVTGSFRAASTTLRAITEVLRAVITGDWSQVRRNVIDTVARLWQSVTSWFRTGRDRAVETVAGMVGSVTYWVRTLPGKARSALWGIWSTLYQAGRDLISGFISGIDSRIPSVRDILRGLTGSIPFWKGPPSKDKTLLTNAGELIMQGFQDGLESRYSDIRKSLGGFTGVLGREAGAAVPFGPGARLSPTGNTFNIAVHFDQTMTEEEMGRQYAKAIKAFTSRGGRV